MDPITEPPPTLEERKTGLKDYFSCEKRTEVKKVYECRSIRPPVGLAGR